MINFETPDHVKEVINSLERFIETEIKPFEEKYRTFLENEHLLFNENRLYKQEIRDSLATIREKSAEAGFYSMFGEAELGGMGDVYGPLAACLIFEYLTKEHGNNIFIQEIFPPGLFTGGLTPVLTGLTNSLREELLPKFKNGKKILCFALSEPEAGSDVWALKTIAKQDGDYWIINGTKQWITNSPYADYAVVFAITDEELVQKRRGGISAFLVPFDGETCMNTSVIPYLGSVGSNIGIVTLENARVHKSHIIGELNDGFGRALEGIDIGRIVMAARSVGVAQWALQKTVDYANQRKTFGKTIGSHQAIQMMLADSAIDIYAARNMIIHTAWKMEKQSRLPIKEISMVKAFNTEMVFRVLDRCMQVHGGMGLTNELGLESLWRWARSMRIPDGTSEIQRRTVARRLLNGDLQFE